MSKINTWGVDQYAVDKHIELLLHCLVVALECAWGNGLAYWNKKILAPNFDLSFAKYDVRALQCPGQGQ
jgi:hypothetical protein